MGPAIRHIVHDPKCKRLLLLGSQGVKLKSVYLTMNSRRLIKRRRITIYRFSVARSSPSGFRVGPILDPICIWTNERGRLSFFESVQLRLFLFRSREARPKLALFIDFAQMLTVFILHACNAWWIISRCDLHWAKLFILRKRRRNLEKEKSLRKKKLILLAFDINIILFVTLNLYLLK